MLPPKSNVEIKNLEYKQKPYWDIERARIGDSREVPVEVLVNGQPVARKKIVADGKLREVSFDVPIERSSWVALRILPSSHTNPVFVVVDEKPIRASKKSAEWCLQATEKCWTEKKKAIRKEELAEAEKAYDFARSAYKKIAEESD